MVATTEKQNDAVDGSGHPTAAVDRKDAHETGEKAQHRDLEAGRPEAGNHGPSSLLSDDDDDEEEEEEDDDDDGPPSPPLTRISTNVSLGPDNPVEHYTSFVEVPDSVYDRLPARRKLVVVALLSYCAFLAPISSTTVLSATPEVAAEFRTTGAVVNVTNALYMLFMGISPIVWGPFSEVWGRKVITCTTAFLFFGCSIGTALAPNLAAFFVFRILTAFEGTAFLLVGSACLQDIYRPTERATAMGWFLSGTLIGPALGPFLGGIIVTYASWRDIFWLQTGLSGLAALGALFILPETIHHKKYDDLHGLSKRRKAAVLWNMVNPWKILKLMVSYPNLILAGIASASLVWNMYSLLTPIRYVLNPRFHLTTPMQSGLFYLAPGAGYLVGTFFGGRYADHVVKKHMARSPAGARVPEDRLRSALPFLGGAIPACVLVYGWCVQADRGGIPVVVVVLFAQGVAQLFCFPSLNTYCLDVMQGRGSDVIAGNYFVRYLFACMGTAVVLPAVESIGVGWFSTISALFLVCSALGTWAIVVWGRGWREAVDAKKRRRRKKRRTGGQEAVDGRKGRKKGGGVAGPGVSGLDGDVEAGGGQRESTSRGITDLEKGPLAPVDPISARHKEANGSCVETPQPERRGADKS